MEEGKGAFLAAAVSGVLASSAISLLVITSIVSSAVGSYFISTGAPKGTKNPVRYHLDGGWFKISV
ncbi:hypothetical protein NIES73_43720 [Sphaerospermopsis kisseleviana NIES-73]|nr:hypothetical protein NIES73_43720 [Sphaerospermopsis kisseleviana NIES-73]